MRNINRLTRVTLSFTLVLFVSALFSAVAAAQTEQATLLPGNGAPLLVTPEVHLTPPAPPVGASNAAAGNTAGATNATVGAPLMAKDLGAVMQYAGPAYTVTITPNPATLQRAASSLTEGTTDKAEDTIVVDVWSSAAQTPSKPKEADTTRLSPGFAAAALSAGSRIQFTQQRVTNSIKMGFPLGGGFWIQTDLDAIDDSLGLAALAATNDADREALQELQNQTDRLRVWCDWLIDQNRNLRLANYFISPDPLNNDERYQNIATCTRFLLSMVASGRLQEEDRSCR